MKLTKRKLKEIIREVIKKLNEDKIKPSFAKKAKDAIEKVLGTSVEFDGENEFKVKGKSVGIYVDYYKHPLYGDTFEIFSLSSAATGVEQGGSVSDALKGITKFTKKNKKVLLTK